MAETRLQSILDRKILYNISIGRVNVDLVILFGPLNYKCSFHKEVS